MTEKLRPVEKADLFRLKFLQAGALSPDGKRAVYAVAQVDAEKEEEKAALWIVDVKSGESYQLTNGQARDANPAWSPDGKTVAFMSTRDGKPQIYTIPVDGGEARALTNLEQGVGGGPAWSPDGKHIAFTAGRANNKFDPNKPFRVSRHVYRFDAIGYVDPAVQDIYVIAASGGEARQLTNDACINANPKWSPDGKEILYLAMMAPDTHVSLYPRLHVVNVIDGNVREVAGGKWGAVMAGAWLPDGEHVVFAGTPFGKPIGSKSDLWVVCADGGEPECRTAGLKFGIGGGLQADMPVMIGGNIGVTKDGKSAFVQVQDGGTVQIYRIALSGKEAYEPVLSGDRAHLFLGLSADSRSLAYVVSGFNTPSDLYVSDIEGGSEKRLTSFNDDLLGKLRLPNVERLLFPGSDGVQVEGWIITPSTGKPPFPTILYIHGGPHGAFGHIYHFDTQMLCGAGYAVLMVNHRASTGYGDEFSTPIKGDWGNLDYKDLMAGVDYAIEKGIADPDRLGVCGLSGGGNLSTWIVGNTDRFKAAVPENPVTNWNSFYGVSDIGVFFAVEELGGHPWEIPEVYRKCSPITYAHNCKTPTLLIQGEHDWRCPAEQSEQFYAVLKANGCIVEMLRLPNASHAGTIAGAPVNRRVHNDALLDWMNRYVLGKPAEKDIV